MKTINEYLDDLKINLGSDYAIAKGIGITKQSVSIIRKGGNIKDETAIKIADLLGIDRNEVLIAAAVARSEGEVKKAWLNISKISGMTASFALATGATLANSSGDALSALSSIYYQVCILCKIVSRRISGLVIALDPVFTKRSHKNGGNKENELLPYAKENHTERAEMRRSVRRRRERNRTDGQGRRSTDNRAISFAMG